MANKRKLVVEIAGDASGAKKAFGETEKSSSSWGSKLGKVAGGVALGLGGVGLAAGAMGLDLVHAAEDSNKVTAQSAAVIKSTGGAAHITARQVAELSTALSLKAGVDDELIQSGENVLLTFTNVRNEVGKGNDVFTQATGLALDMSTALGTDMQGSVIQLGKALNDPVKGITALSRVGVSFTKQQKDQIATLVKHHDTLGAQKVILGELTKEFGGSAAAQATSSQKLSVAWGNMQEELGNKLLPVFNAVSGWIMKEGIPAIESLSAWVQEEVVPVLQDWGVWLGDHVLPALQAVGSYIADTIVPALVDFGQWLGRNQDVLKALAIGIVGALVPAFVAWAVSAGAAAVATLLAAAPFILLGAAIAAFAFLVIHNWDTIKRVTVTVFNAVKGAIETAFNWVKRNWPLLLGIITGPIGLAVLVITKNWDKIKAGFTAVKNWIGDRVNDIVSFFRNLPGRLAAAGRGMWDWIGRSFKSALNVVIRAWNSLQFKLPSFGGISVMGHKIGAFSGPTIGTPNIPLLAEGGVVHHRPGGILARIGEGRFDEAVTPLDGRESTPMQVTIDLRGAVIASDIEFERMVKRAFNNLAAQGAVHVRGRRF